MYEDIVTGGGAIVENGELLIHLMKNRLGALFENQEYEMRRFLENPNDKTGMLIRSLITNIRRHDLPVKSVHCFRILGSFEMC